MTTFEWWCAVWYAATYKDQNVWPPRNESGIDYRRMPSLAGSGLEKYFLRARGEKPVVAKQPESFWELVLEILAIPLFILLSPMLIAEGAEVFERILEDDARPVPAYSWAEMTALIQSSDWEHQ
jgi:hypothetical protein